VVRKLKGAVAYVLGPIVGTAYYLFLMGLNLRKPAGYVALRIKDRTIPVRIIREVRGLPGMAGAITFGRTVLTRYRFPSSALVRHELVHVSQYERYGWVRFLALYAKDTALRGYEGSLLEAEARAAQNL
jgi:hypothetical protein